MSSRPLVIGSRGSRLALLQAEWVRDRLLVAQPDLNVKIEAIATKADKMLDAPLAKIGDKGLFIKELEQALLEGRIDMAVHSAKDVPTELPPQLALGALTEREQVHDVFVGAASSVSGIPEGARVGSSSLRRRSQLLALRPDLELVDIRGNVQTRLRKLEAGVAQGTVLAAAGLNRLGRVDLVAFVFGLDELLPAVGQGALAVEVRADDDRVGELVAIVNHEPTALELRAERTLMRELEGGCQVPIAGLAELDGERLRLRAFVGSLDGRQTVHAQLEAPASQPEELGRSLAEKLRQRGATSILEQVRTAAAADSQPSA
jgi:hydroxymethylbilane synthase